jgi:hypothetical protein
MKGRFFEKKRRKKLLIRCRACGATAESTPMAESLKSLFGSFSSEKELLTFFGIF